MYSKIQKRSFWSGFWAGKKSGKKVYVKKRSNSKKLDYEKLMIMRKNLFDYFQPSTQDKYGRIKSRKKMGINGFSRFNSFNKPTSSKINKYFFFTDRNSIGYVNSFAPEKKKTGHGGW